MINFRIEPVHFMMASVESENIHDLLDSSDDDGAGNVEEEVDSRNERAKL